MPEEKKPSLSEQLTAWLRDKESMAAELKAAKEASAAQAAKITDLENQLAAGATAATQAAADLTAAQASVTILTTESEARLASLTAFAAAVGLKLDDLSAATPEAAATAIQNAVAQHISAGVAQKQAELGVPSAQLPAQSATGATETLEEVQSALLAETDPVKRGQLAARANKLRDALQGRN